MAFFRKKASKIDKIEREATANAVEIRNLAVEYDTSKATVKAVNGIDLTLKKKHTLGLVGETGAGKTTAMLALMGLVPDPPGVIKSGEIRVNGIDMRRLTPGQLSAVRGSEIAIPHDLPEPGYDGRRADPGEPAVSPGYFQKGSLGAGKGCFGDGGNRPRPCR